MGKDRKDRDREAKGRERDERGRDRDERGSVNSDEERKERKKEKPKDRGRERGRNRSRERGRDRSRERDRDRNKEKRDGDREKTRKRSRERDSRRDEKDRSHELKGRDKKEQGRSRRRSSSGSGDESTHTKKRLRAEDDGGLAGGGGGVAKSSGDISLSIEETNKLRASLGLKPLQTVEQQEDGSSSGTKEVHAPPTNIGSLQAAEKLKEKMETIREKRKQHKKLSGMKTLGEPEEEETASDWVQKLRVLQEEKEKADKRAQLLAEMDEEFGVGELIQGTLQQQKQQAYSSSDLQGLGVEHKTEEFLDGKDIVLTLKDSGILEDAGDVLVNVNIIEKEKAAQNVELRKKKAIYNPYEDEDEDEPGLKPSVLKKYDEEIEGIKKPMFELGDRGTVDTSQQRAAEIVKQKLQSQAMSLEQGPVQIASEYFTKNEMVQFRKPKRKKKIRRLKAEDLVGLPSEERSDNLRDHGSRKRLRSDEDSGVVNEEVDPLVGSALQRTRRLVKEGRTKRSGAARVAEIVQSNDVKMEEASMLGDAIVLDKTAEFCRQLGDEDEAITIHEGRADTEQMDVQESDVHEELGGWTEVELNAPKEFHPKEEELYQEAEPDVSSGLSAALQMAVRKGFIDTEKQKRDSSSVVHVYSDAHRDRDYERQKERERERELSHSRSMSFVEKKSYNPHINIEYVDDNGRALTPKEAFRHLSHKFHGRGSGKKKTERRLKKLQEEHFMNKSNSVDTPLNTLAMLQSKQQKSQTPYIFISGGSQSMLAPDLEKK